MSNDVRMNGRRRFGQRLQTLLGRAIAVRPHSRREGIAEVVATWSGERRRFGLRLPTGMTLLRRAIVARLAPEA
jgi:hypothetical protein